MSRGGHRGGGGGGGDRGGGGDGGANDRHFMQRRGPNTSLYVRPIDATMRPDEVKGLWWCEIQRILMEHTVKTQNK